MHLCPYCEKLGISTFSAIGDPFSRGLASCRYCTNTSKRKPSIVRIIGGPIMALLLAAAIYFLKPTIHTLWIVFFLFFFIFFSGFLIIDRCVEFEKIDKKKPEGEAPADSHTVGF